MNKQILGVTLLFVTLMNPNAHADNAGSAQWGLQGYDTSHSNWDQFRPRPRSHSWPRYDESRDEFGASGVKFERVLSRGVQSGALSRAEVRDLREHQRLVRQNEAYYWSDGRLSFRERQQLSEDYLRLRNDLEHQLRDGERRNAGFYWRD